VKFFVDDVGKNERYTAHVRQLELTTPMRQLLLGMVHDEGLLSAPAVCLHDARLHLVDDDDGVVSFEAVFDADGAVGRARLKYVQAVLQGWTPACFAFDVMAHEFDVDQQQRWLHRLLLSNGAELEVAFADLQVDVVQ